MAQQTHPALGSNVTENRDGLLRLTVKLDAVATGAVGIPLALHRAILMCG